MSEQKSKRTKIVVIGAGFGGLAAVMKMRKLDADITVIDKRNHHLFQPLLYQVATAALSPGDIAKPIRSHLRKHENTTVLMDTVTDIDRDERCVKTKAARCIPYDYLIVATGSTHNYFGNKQWKSYAPPLKTLDDAANIRARILTAFELAEIAESEAEQDELMTFVITGGGPTGVEMAGAVAELARFALSKDFENINPDRSRIILVNAGERLLQGFPEKLSHNAQKDLEDMGVEIILNTYVNNVDGDHVMINDEQLSARTVIWAAGVKPSPAWQWLGSVPDENGRVVVNQSLNLDEDDRVFVVGDTAYHIDEKGREMPGLAAVAKQMGQHAARVITYKVGQGGDPGPFKYRDYGIMATIGRNSAVAKIRKIELSGSIAWWLWGLVHIYFLTGVRNKIAVAVNWFWNYLTYARGVRLIKGDLSEQKVKSSAGSSDENSSKRVNKNQGNEEVNTVSADN